MVQDIASGFPCLLDISILGLCINYFRGGGELFYNDSWTKIMIINVRAYVSLAVVSWLFRGLSRIVVSDGRRGLALKC